MLYRKFLALEGKSFSKPHPLKYNSDISHMDRIREFRSPINSTCLCLLTYALKMKVMLPAHPLF